MKNLLLTRRSRRLVGLSLAAALSAALIRCSAEEPRRQDAEFADTTGAVAPGRAPAAEPEPEVGDEPPPAPRRSGRVYHEGPRGGCYTYSRSGRKEYVDHSFCR